MVCPLWLPISANSTGNHGHGELQRKCQPVSVDYAGNRKITTGTIGEGLRFKMSIPTQQKINRNKKLTRKSPPTGHDQNWNKPASPCWTRQLGSRWLELTQGADASLSCRMASVKTAGTSMVGAQAFCPGSPWSRSVPAEPGNLVRPRDKLC